MEIERARGELRIEGDFEGKREAFPTITRMMGDVLDHGEVHASFQEFSQEVEVRQGTATFDFEGEVISIDDGITTHSFAMDHLSQWEKPMNVFEAE